MHLGEVRIDSFEILRTVHRLGIEITKDYIDRQITLCVVLKGAFIFASDLLRDLPDNTVTTFVRANSYRTGDTRSIVYLSDFLYGDEECSYKGADVIIIEDIIDTGHTAWRVLQAIAMAEPTSLRVCTLLHKPSGTKRKMKIDYKGFKIPNKWVVGYGMDYNEKYRNRTSIYDLEGQPSTEGL